MKRGTWIAGESNYVANHHGGKRKGERIALPGHDGGGGKRREKKKCGRSEIEYSGFHSPPVIRSACEQSKEGRGGKKEEIVLKSERINRGE